MSTPFLSVSDPVFQFPAAPEMPAAHQFSFCGLCAQCFPICLHTKQGFDFYE